MRYLMSGGNFQLYLIVLLFINEIIVLYMIALSRCLVTMKSDNIKSAENCHLCHLLTIWSWIYERVCVASLWLFC